MSGPIDIASPMIREAVRIAVAAGNELKLISTEWEPKQVAFMALPIDPEVRAEIEGALPNLEWLLSKGTPHNPGTEDLVDRTNDVVLAFPAPGEERRWY